MSTPNQRRSLARPRPSLGKSGINTASSPSLNATYTSSQRPPLPNPLPNTFNSATARKASFTPLTSGTLSTIPDGSVGYGLASTKEEESSQFTMPPGTPASQRRESDHGTIEVGDAVDVPGGMHGTVKFLGSVRNRDGVFVGVELSREWAARGKNDGDVDGIRYFTLSIPGAGIFLPLARATKRASPTVSADSFPPTPTSPSLKGFNLGGEDSNAYTTTTPSAPAHKFGQSVGRGRAPSPAFQPKSRPSLPRPESPLRKTQNLNSTPAGRPSFGAPQISKGGIGGPRYAPSPTPGKFGASMRGQRNSTAGDPGKKRSQPPKQGMRTPVRPSSRSQSRLGPESMFDEFLDTTPIGIATTRNERSEVEILKAKLEERDRQLKEQASSLTEMDHNVAELQSLLPNGNNRGSARGGRGSGLEDADAAQLRALLREKNEKIAILTAEFDAHRADFRSTIDTLELASTETERVYERRVDELLQEVRELQGRDDDFESVAQQLKQLEELVQELEEGLEDARRGEAEARGEVEFLRGEVERGRSELRREREKAAAAQRGAGAAVDGAMSPGSASRDLEQRDDEIRGLKAIIHSLSRDSVPDVKATSRRTSKQKRDSSEQANGQSAGNLAQERQAKEKLEREVKELEGLVDQKKNRVEELEREVERLRSEQTGSQRGSTGSNEHSEPTSIRGSRNPARDPKRRHNQQLETTHEGDNQASANGANNLWCEICDSHGHDILTCTSMFGDPARQGSSQEEQKEGSPRTGRDVVKEGLKGLSVPSPHADDRVAPLSPGIPRSAPSTPRIPRVPMPNPMDQGLVAGKATGVIDETKWCALCERDGHESVDCPFEEDF
ncbi:MAG: hypothetical protein FRX48_00350 [Lasallia pustulata]|uniref:CAP-Gly domain-containing protein n=1 Tax=Lasallia pustulata TaxID=136370 RepID=A0A5M8Q0F5_9LECA|nr:MAG: hypothetical protein FRX48_00350 [Lasallia pustulata]